MGPWQMMESIVHAALTRPTQATLTALEQLGYAMMTPYMAPGTLLPPAPMPYVAPSAAGYQTVPLAQMSPEDARAALLAMDLSPQFLDAMKADLQHCTNPLSPGWNLASQHQFVATYGHLVAMPQGLDSTTVAALNRMLAPPESSVARTSQPRQAVPVADMSPEDARAVLQALDVPAAVIDRMTTDVLVCIETTDTPEGRQRAQQFRQDHGQLLALPERMDMETLFKLLDILQGVHPAEADRPAAATAQVQESSPRTGRAALHTLEPAEMLQQLFALGMQESQLRAMSAQLQYLDALSPEMGGDEQIYARQAHEFAETYGPLFNMPLQMDLMTRIALARMLEPFSEHEQ